jgi:anti-anti-sigma regulatory factor
MEIIREVVSGPPPVTILRLTGDLDASSYQDLINSGRNAYKEGARNLVLDFEKVGFMSSSGLVALHSLAVIMRGESPPDLEHGWDTIHVMGEYVESSDSFEKQVKLLRPSQRLMSILDKTGFSHLFEIYSDQNTALASFR